MCFERFFTTDFERFKIKTCFIKLTDLLYMLKAPIVLASIIYKIVFILMRLLNPSIVIIDISIIIIEYNLTVFTI